MVFRMNPDKAPGPDGFSTSFFQKFWHIVGDDVTLANSSFFDGGRLLKELNHTSLTLAPKTSNPLKLSDFRPIAFCNFIYKCISGILATRLKVVLPNLIDDAHATFIPGRNMSDNIFLVQELLRNYHRSDTQARCAIKVNQLKAFDTVKWSFLLDLLIKMGFPRFVGWIRECITTQQFSININGSLLDSLAAQGGFGKVILSPLIFLPSLWMLYLCSSSRKLRLVVGKGSL